MTRRAPASSSRLATRPRSRLALAVAALTLAGNVFSLVHFIEHEHAISSQTGQVFHPHETNGDPAPSGDRPAEPAGSREECQVLATLTHATVLPGVFPALAFTTPGLETAVEPPRVEIAPLGQKRLWLLAPSLSPPVVLA